MKVRNEWDGRVEKKQWCRRGYLLTTVMFWILQGPSNTSIRAVTVRQILNAQQAHSEGDITVDGLEVGHVSVSIFGER
jgi:hypothetical protein